MRDLHIVIPTTGRPSCSLVAREAIQREDRLARLTIVTQGGPRALDADLARLAEKRGVVLDEVVLTRPVGPGTARHIGTAAGNEDFVGFLDDDIRFDAGSMSVLAELCDRAELGGACGVVTVPDVSVATMIVKAICFRSIFRDPRLWATRRRQPVRSNLLSGGMAVYRRALYDRCASAWLGFEPEARGEDIELSYAVSRLASLAVDPSVRVRNLSAQHPKDKGDATTRALRHLARYRTFATRHASARRHWVAYGAVLVGVTARGLVEGAGVSFIKAVIDEVARTLRGGRPLRSIPPAPCPQDPAQENQSGRYLDGQ